MTVFNLYIFNRVGTCLYYQEWERNKKSLLSQDEEFKLMFGMLFSLKSFASRLSPFDQKEGLISYRTNCYKLNFYETPSGLKFLLNTDLNVGNVREILQQLYSQVFVEYIDKSPLCNLNEPIQSDLFRLKVHEFISSLPFSAPSI